MKAYLTPEQINDLHNWIAKDYPPYHQLRRLMLQRWGFVISSQAVSYHRHKYADLIALLHKKSEIMERRKAADRMRKRRAPTDPPDCA